MPFLLRLRRQTMAPHLLAAGTDLSEEEHERRVRYRFDCAVVLLFDGLPAGLLKVARDGAAWQLIQIQLAPELQGRGLGQRLIEGVLAEARKAGAPVELDVLKINPARRLYERLGFAVVAENEHSFDMRYTPDAIARDATPRVAPQPPGVAPQTAILAGKCLCGAVNYVVEDKFRYALNCHCSNCRRSTGSAFKPFAGIERDKLRITAGAENIMTFGDASAHDVRCRDCGSLLYSVVRDGAFVHVTLGTLVDTPAIRPTAHMFAGSKAAWFTITDDLPQHDEFG